MHVDYKKLNSIADFLRERGLKLALVESMTAGYFSAVWSLQVHAGDFLEGSIVAFSREVKESLLKVPPSLIETYTTESLIVTERMVTKLRDLIVADVYIGITGLAYGGGDIHPTAEVGDVFLVFYYNQQTLYVPIQAKYRDAAEVYMSAFNQSLQHLEDFLHNHSHYKSNSHENEL